MRILVFIVLILSAYSLNGQPDNRYVRKGNSKYNDGNYQQAELAYRKALEKNSGSYKADYNLGNTLYKQKQFEAAGSRYTELAKKESDPDKLNRYYYNLGNAMYESKKYQESIEAYKKALKNKPSDMDAKHNLQLALRMLQEQKQQQQQNQQKNQQQNKDKNKKDNPQDQQNKDQQNKDQQNKNQQDQQNQQNQNQKNQQQMPQNGQISKEDADRILQALENEEKQVLKKVQDKKEHMKKVPVDKNW